PQGQLIPLPKGATPVDFAFAVHSEVGNHCCGAKVNSQLVPLHTQLKNGDQVEIITNKNQTPTPTWEDFVVTGKARSEIKKFVRQQRSEQYISLGRSIIEKAAKVAHIELTDENLKIAINKFNKKSLDDLYYAIGEGSVNREEVIKLLQPSKVTKFTSPFS